jgi:DNA polymerase I-like protein with 3'-5' exonuclease and polymerase domains
MDLSNPDVEWFMPSEFPDLTNNRTMAIDLETRDPNLTTMGPGWATKHGEIIGIAIAAGDFSGYFPIAHAKGPNLDRKVVFRWLQKQLATPHITKIMHNASYDLGWLMASGITVQGPVIDTMLVAPLLDENRLSYRLDLLGKDYLGMRKDEKVLKSAAAEWGIDPKAEMWKLPARYVGVYAEQDAVRTLKLWERLKPLLEDQSLLSVCDLEHRVLPVVIDMRMRGVRVDLDKAEIAKKELRKKADELAAWIARESGVKVDPWAAASVQKMFDALGLPYPRTEAGAPSFTKQFLQAMDHPVAKALVNLREMDKADSTFIDSILRFQHNGRIHCEMHQLRSDDGGTVTGRFASSHPNMQQLPARDPFVKQLIRGLFIPEDGCRWGSFDYSSQEPRLLVHFAASHPETERDAIVAQYVEGYGSGDFDFHQMTADLTGLNRKAAKTCIAEGQLVLTHVGLVPIEKITVDHLVWDGVEWVGHEGVVYMGEKEVITYDGLTATADHEVWVGRERTLPFGVAASRLERLSRTGIGERPVRLVDDCFPEDRKTWQAHLREGALRLWGRGLEAAQQLARRKIDGLPSLQYAGAAPEGWQYAGELSGREVFTGAHNRDHAALHQPKGQELEELRGQRDTLQVLVLERVRGLPNILAPSRGLEGVRGRQDRQQRTLRTGELAPCHLGSEPAEQTQDSLGRVSGPEGCSGASLASDQDRPSGLFVWSSEGSNPAGTGDETRGYPELRPTRKARVYDIRNAGPRHRFTVSGRLVHNCGLGILYGMGKGKMAQQLGISLEEAASILSRFDDKVPFVKKLAMLASTRADREGKIRTIGGRLCRFDLWEPASFGYNKPMKYDDAQREYGGMGRLRRAFTYKALNRVIQGSAADQNKLAMAQCYEEGLVPLLTVHDELCFNVETDEQAARITKIMEEGLSLKVPSKVDQELGNNWGEAG